MPGDAAEYRQFAENCRRLAAASRTVSGRNTLLRFAEIWDRLADEEESTETLRKVLHEMASSMAAE
jgi:hypothetical protein